MTCTHTSTRVDGGRVGAAVREHLVQSILSRVPVVMVQLGVVAAWIVYLLDGWNLATALLVSGAVAGFDYFGSVAGQWSPRRREPAHGS